MRNFGLTNFIAALLIMMPLQGFTVDNRVAILSDITKFAKDNCEAFSTRGRVTTGDVDAGVSAGLSGLFRRLLGFGAEADVNVSKSVKEYEGPVQDQLLEFAKNREDCRVRLIDQLLIIFFPQTDNNKKSSENSSPMQVKKPSIEATLCTGEYEGNCPGPHSLFLGCPNRTAQEITGIFCPSKRGNITPIKTGIRGNNCGYALLQLTCSD